MEDIEQDKCDFCKKIKPVERTYLRPTKYVKSGNTETNIHLHNGGDYFIIIKTCNDCGLPKSN